METIHVKITTSQSAPPFQRQIPNKSYIWDNIHFHICDDFATPDAWFVIDDLPHEETVKINKKNIFRKYKKRKKYTEEKKAHQGSA